MGSTVFGVIKSDINGNITVRYLICARFVRCSCSMQTQPKRDFSSFFLIYLQKIKAVYLTDPEKYVTLQDIVEAEREAQAAQWPKVGATLALMWLKR